MNTLPRAALDALVRLLAPGSAFSGASTTAGTITDRTFAEQQYVAPAWEHGHVPMSVDLYGTFAHVLDARDPATSPASPAAPATPAAPAAPQTPSAEQPSRIGRIGDDRSALGGRHQVRTGADDPPTR